MIGVEGDLAWTDRSDSIKYVVEDDEVSAEMGWLATILASGGVAWRDMSHTSSDDYTDPVPDKVGAVDFSDMGWAFGGGAEYAVNEHFSVKADLLFNTFDDEIDDSDLVLSDPYPEGFVELENVFVTRKFLIGSDAETKT